MSEHLERADELDRIADEAEMIHGISWSVLQAKMRRAAADLRLLVSEVRKSSLVACAKSSTGDPQSTGEAERDEWHRAGDLIYTLAQEGWRKGEPVMVNRLWVTVGRDARYATEEEHEATVQLVLRALSDPSLRSEGSNKPGWRPIETAPTDGTWFVALQDGETYPCEWQVTEPDEGPGDEGWWDHFNRSFEQPTHWQPLPTPSEAWNENAQRHYTARELKALLDERDAFLVKNGMWEAFVASLPTPSEGESLETET